MKAIILISFVVAGVCADLSQSKNPVEDGEVLIDVDAISADLADQHVDEFADEFSEQMNQAVEYLKVVVKLLEDDVPKVYHAAKAAVEEAVKLYHKFAQGVGLEREDEVAEGFLPHLYRRKLAAERKQISENYLNALRDIVEKFSGLPREEINKWSQEDLENYVIRLFDIRF